jgi:nucleotide-binding universal stress UspA family protein
MLIGKGEHSMGFKDIVVHLDTSQRSVTRLEFATRLASRHGAHLTGFFVVDVPDSTFFYGGAVPYASGAIDLVAHVRGELLEASKAVQEHFATVTAREGLSTEWRVSEGRSGQMIALNARYGDLVIVGQPHDPNAREVERSDEIVVTTLMSSGRPVLAIPFVGTFPTVGERVLVAWNASREATRAINDAMPILRLAEKVTVLAINPRLGIRDHGDVPAADIALHLARHGVKAEAAHTVASDIPDGEALLSYAADISADLIVAGGYGHSRARELIFGGVTQTLLREMTVPIFLSH